MTPEALRALIIDRSVRVIYGVGPKTEADLNNINIRTVRDIYDNRQAVINRLGNHGQYIVDLAEGIDGRKVGAESKSHSLSTETTFQADIKDFTYLKDVLRLMARDLSYQIRVNGTFCRTVTLKITYEGFKKITRSKSGETTNRADDIYKTAASLLDKIEKKPVRLIGISLSGLTNECSRQITLFDTESDGKDGKVNDVVMSLQQKYGAAIVKTGSELIAEKRLGADEKL
jgi:DNA polymerase-4/DNA polymerase IV (DinB-like DNA polymerase)